MLEWLVPALISGATSAYSANLASRGQEDANEQNLAIANAQMQFQEKSFRNRHQWEVEDLRAAGLNPILSATGGQAPILSGASATMQNTKRDASDIIANSSKSVIDIVNGVMSALKARGETANITKEGKILDNKVIGSEFEKVTSQNKAVESKYTAQYAEQLARDQIYKADLSKIASAKAANEMKYESPATAWMRHVGGSAKPWLDFGGHIADSFVRGKLKVQNKYPIPYRDYGRR